MAIKRVGISFTAEDERLIMYIQNVLKKDQGYVSKAAVLRYALRQTVAQLKTREGK